MEFPLGLLLCHSHKSEAMAEDMMLILERVGIVQADIYRCANDTTNSSVKVGKLVLNTEDGGRCDFHVGELCALHSTGFKVRKHDNKVVDSNPCFVAFEKVVRSIVKFIMNGKSLTRYEKYKTFHKNRGKSTRKLYLPGSTR